jgi:hypothetical protein
MGEVATDQQKLRYPNGKFQDKDVYTMHETMQSIKRLEQLPALYIVMVGSIKDRLHVTYRDHGWTALEVINHVIDVYLNAYLRTKWLLTEKDATLKPYDENEFTRLADGRFENVDSTLILLRLLMNRFVFLLRSLPAESFDFTIYHPEYDRHYSLHKLVANYDWHGYHHLAHLEIIKNKNA